VSVSALMIAPPCPQGGELCRRSGAQSGPLRPDDLVPEIRRRVAAVPEVQSVEVVLQDHFVQDELHRLINLTRARNR